MASSWHGGRQACYHLPISSCLFSSLPSTAHTRWKDSPPAHCLTTLPAALSYYLYYLPAYLPVIPPMCLLHPNMPQKHFFLPSPPMSPMRLVRVACLPPISLLFFCLLLLSLFGFRFCSFWRAVFGQTFGGDMPACLVLCLFFLHCAGGQCPACLMKKEQMGWNRQTEHGFENTV